VLLPKKTNPVENLASSGTGQLEALPQLGILQLEPLDALWRELGPARRAIDGLHASFGLKRTTPKARQLLAQVSDKLLKLRKRFDFRTIAV